MAELEVGTADGVYVVDVELEEVAGFREGETLARSAVESGLPLAIAEGRSGSTVAVVLDRRPPLVVSHDSGLTWREAGGGLPSGVAVAVGPENPDLIAYAGRNRLYVSEDGGRFWRALVPELPEIMALRLVS